ncbi:type II secretion system F family protein [Chitinimonas sp.]|uniref:type II secretion system F family protein n=1 Tax=Chitinimonas sp. TaxID=1934313 RepID=UPI0035B4B3B1
MRFIAKTLTLAGAVEEIALEAESATAAEARLRAEGVRVVSVKPAERGVDFQLGRERFMLAVFNQQLHSLLEAGQSIVDAIDILQHNDAGGAQSRVYDGLLQALRQGKQLSEAMAQQAGVFPPLYVAMVRASETTGSVRVAVRRYIEYQTQVAQIRSKLVSASVYPAILVCVGMLVIGFLLLYVVPRFSMAFDDVSKNGEQLGGFVYVWGNFVRAHELLAWGGSALLMAMLIAVLVHPVARRVALQTLLKLPAVGRRIRVFQLARLYRTLGLLLRSGVPLTHALRMTRDSMPVHYQAQLDAARAQVEEGIPLSRALLAQQLATEVASRLIVAGESSGNLDEMLGRVADFHDQEVSGWVDMIGRVIEPALMVGIGLVIGVVVMLLYMPIFELANSVQ